MVSALIREPALYIGGDWIAGSGGECAVENPATEQTTGVVTQAADAEIDRAVAAARGAFDSWASTPVAARIDALRRLYDAVTGRAYRFAALITREQGSPPYLARKLHVDLPLRVIASTVDALAGFAFRGRQGDSVILREPVGVVAAIMPWNLPLYQIVAKVVPALAAGCTVVLKPATLTPLTAFEFARAVEAAGFPPGVFNVVTGGGRDVGECLVRHELVDHVSFTGSTAVGRRVAAAAAETVKGVTLELSGKSASVVLSDVSDELLARAVQATVANCFLNGGQTCSALSRLIVPRARLGQVEKLAAAAAAEYVPGERLGPLISAGRRFAVESYLEQATARVVSAPLELPRTGYYVTPTVYSEVEPDSRLAQDEIFGPVLSILAAESDDHAIELANNSIYGLSGALWVGDDDRALDWAARIRTGQVHVNAAPFNPRAPFGGYKQSGLGREMGDYGIDRMLQVKAVQL
ncbi:aldehyde dehydrogenase family protein [Nocardia sp. alder85J]|uniref:aldehyde dehydrogenase family protein n=1 Tax=Nocardia sp. alder85J TaxID=2862949 RepID=UPI001CD7C16A|nr:aldehyde dehydrogenase family protein [Nocardia sp. alder85J]MCX4095634.1 aldehyde dehydrogenase family protein [Nocardia sp. alder85J]